MPQADLRSLDPIWSTAYSTRNYGYMVYDTLFAVNEMFEVQPQMVDKWTLSDDKLTYTFVLRLKKPFSLTFDALAKPSLNVLLFPPYEGVIHTQSGAPDSLSWRWARH